jgi:hypothetical protein
LTSPLSADAVVTPDEARQSNAAVAVKTRKFIMRAAPAAMMAMPVSSSAADAVLSATRCRESMNLERFHSFI